MSGFHDRKSNRNGKNDQTESGKTDARVGTERLRINDATTRFTSLDYGFNEDLLRIVDETEAFLAADADARKSMSVPRHLPKLDEQEELDHFRRTFAKWE